ncbi:AMP-binding protein [Streptomyces roseolilacinus]|uniref:AMP-binding protein n=1 Tax=Streptomyces roseolilacinus TaxID=66904 RepID=UPI00380ECD92
MVQDRGTPAADAPPFATLVEAVRAHAERGVAQTVGAAGDDEPDYPAFWRRAAWGAARLRERGVRRGDRVAVEMDSSTAVLVAAMAVWSCGAVLVPVMAAGRLAPETQDGRRALAAMRAARAGWCLAGADPDAFAAAAAGAGLRVTVLAVEEVAAPGDPARTPPHPPACGPDDAALVQFSSGSLAAPKGIVLTHRNLAANLHALTRRIELVGGRTAVWLPLSHDMGLIGSYAGSLYGGSAFRALPPRTFVRDPLRWIEELADFRATHTGGPPFGYEMAVRRARHAGSRLAGLDLSALRAGVIGAERIPPELCERFDETFGPHGARRHVLLPAYGLAENCVAVACRAPLRPAGLADFDPTGLEHGLLVPLPPQPVPRARPAADRGPVRRLIGHGAPLPGTDVRIVSPDGLPLPEGRIGEIRIGGAAVTAHTLGADGETRPARGEDGLVGTGDLGALLGGELYVVGRSKEVVAHAGRLVAAVDIEQTVLATAPDLLAAAAAVAVDAGDTAGDTLVVVLELYRRASEAERARLAGDVRIAVLRDFRLPVREVLVGRRGSMPRTTSGKVQRLRLASDYLAGALPAGVTPAPAPAGPAPVTDRRPV